MIDFSKENNTSQTNDSLRYNLEDLSMVRDFLPNILGSESLSTIQESIFCQCWLGLTYRDMAEQLGYDPSYIRLVGSNLWKLLSERLGHKVTKSNFQGLLVRRMREQKTIVSQRYEEGDPSVAQRVDTVLEDFDLYIERFPIETQCYEAIVQEGALIRIKAPQAMGKTLLMSQIVAYAQRQGLRPVVLSFRLADTDTLTGLDPFLQWFCLNLSDQLNLPNQLTAVWQACFSSSYNCTNYLERIILPTVPQGVVIALDDVDVLFRYPKIATDFLGMLRAWCEKAKHVNVSSQIWRRCRFVVVHSTEVYLPLNKHQSPFNIGLSIELPEFSAAQVVTLARRLNLSLNESEIVALMVWIGGKPQLLRMAFDGLMHEATTLANLISDPLQRTSLFHGHLRSQYRKLQQYPDLQSSFEQIVLADSPIAIAPLQGFQLESLGLVALEAGMLARPSCQLYHYYFRQIFEQG